MTGNFYTDTLRKSPLFHSATPCRDIDMLEPVTRAAVQAIIADARTMGVEYRVDETFRSQSLQQQYFAKGLTKLRNVGVHGYGLACDIHWMKDGQFVQDGSKYQLLRFLAEKHGLICGGDWGTPSSPHSFRDFDHVQRVSLARQNDLFAGRWYPDASYRPLLDMPPYGTHTRTARRRLAHAVACVARANRVGD